MMKYPLTLRSKDFEAQALLIRAPEDDEVSVAGAFTFANDPVAAKVFLQRVFHGVFPCCLVAMNES